MIFDILKGIVLVIFTVPILLLGVLMEIVCIPITRHKGRTRISLFIDEMWSEAYKD